MKGVPMIYNGTGSWYQLPVDFPIHRYSHQLESEPEHGGGIQKDSCIPKQQSGYSPGNIDFVQQHKYMCIYKGVGNGNCTGYL